MVLTAVESEAEAPVIEAPVIEPLPDFSRPMEGAWVELEDAPPKPARGRGSRGRATATEATDTTVVALVQEDPPEDAAPPAEAETPVVERIVEAPIAAAVSEPATLAAEAEAPPLSESQGPDVEAFDALPEAAEPVAMIPDPAEISAPPTSPRRGWWRRGA
jgi:ribonuclease E